MINIIRDKEGWEEGETAKFKDSENIDELAVSITNNGDGALLGYSEGGERSLFMTKFDKLVEYPKRIHDVQFDWRKGRIRFDE